MSERRNRQSDIGVTSERVRLVIVEYEKVATVDGTGRTVRSGHCLHAR